MARVLDWQSRGHRFDSDMLHENRVRVQSESDERALFFFTLALAHYWLVCPEYCREGYWFDPDVPHPRLPKL